jgi:hypothetical protein
MVRLYASWLDGEYLRLTASRRPNVETSIENLIKLHALFGNTLLLSDIQVTDCSVVQHLFASEAFRKFAYQRPDLFELVARSRGTRVSDPFVRATSGLYRASMTGWESSSLTDPRPLVDLAETILALEQQTDDLALVARPVLDRWPNVADQLVGVVETINFFTTVGRSSDPATNVPSSSYFDILERLRDVSDLMPQDEATLENAINFVEMYAADNERPLYRSPVRRELRRLQGGLEGERGAIWHTVVAAWNYALQETLGAQGGSIGYLPSAVPVAAYLDNATDAFVHVRGQELPNELGYRPVVVHFPWDLGSLSWNVISTAVSETTSTREAFQSTLLKDDEAAIANAVREHTGALVSQISPEPPTRIANWVWVVAGGVLVVFGQAPVVAGAELGRRTIREVAKRLTRSHLFNTLADGGTAMSRPRTHFSA